MGKQFVKPRKSLIVILAGAIVAGIFLARSTGRTELHISDVTKREERAVQAPWGPFWTTGALYVMVKGTLVGNAVVHIYAHRGRDHVAMILTGGSIDQKWGGAEQWAGDLRVVYQPTTAKSGELKISLFCGQNLK